LREAANRIGGTRLESKCLPHGLSKKIELILNPETRIRQGELNHAQHFEKAGFMDQLQFRAVLLTLNRYGKQAKFARRAIYAVYRFERLSKLRMLAGWKSSPQTDRMLA
jgi:hypothetical protein